MRKSIPDEEYQRLQSQPLPKLPRLNKDSVVNSLISFEGLYTISVFIFHVQSAIYQVCNCILLGFVTAVDETNAFTWYACGSCGSEDIMEVPLG